MNIRSRSSRLSVHHEPRPSNAARRNAGVGSSQTAWPGAASGCTSPGSSRKPSAITPRSLPSRTRSSTISPKPSPRYQWNVSSITSGDRSLQRSAMSIAMNSCSAGLSSGVLRAAWSAIAASVSYSRRPCSSASRRATVDFPAPLPPPSQ